MSVTLSVTFFNCTRTPRSPHVDGSYSAGDIVLARIWNPLENTKSRGKTRPFVLVRRLEGSWRGMGLTTRSRYKDGNPRVAIPEPAAAGLNGPGYLWGQGLTKVYALDIERAIGKVTPPFAEAVISLAALESVDAAALRKAARRPAAEG